MNDANQIQVIPRSELHHIPDGTTRGHAHAAWAPQGAPGHLDFAPLRMCAIGEMYPGESTTMHEHKNIDDFLFVTSGTLRHRDDLGNDATVKTGEAMVFAAGASAHHQGWVAGDQPVDAILFWLTPDELDGPSSFHVCSGESDDGGWKTMAAGTPSDGSVAPLRARSQIHRRPLQKGEAAQLSLGSGRRAYVVSKGGAVRLNGKLLSDGDRALIWCHEAEDMGLDFEGQSSADVFVVDLPPAAGDKEDQSSPN